MKHIDFYEKKRYIHEAMIRGMVEMFKEARIEEIDFTKCKAQMPYIIISPDGAGSTIEIPVYKVKAHDGMIYFESEYYPIGETSCEISGPVIAGGLDDMYESVYEYISTLKLDFWKLPCDSYGQPDGR